MPVALIAACEGVDGVGWVHDAGIHGCPCHMCSLSAHDWHTSVSLHVFISAFSGDHYRTPSSNLLQVIVCSSEWKVKYPQTESKTGVKLETALVPIPSKLWCHKYLYCIYTVYYTCKYICWKQATLLWINSMCACMSMTQYVDNHYSFVAHQYWCGQTRNNHLCMHARMHYKFHRLILYKKFLGNQGCIIVLTHTTINVHRHGALPLAYCYIYSYM